MFGLGFWEIAIILAVALIVLGPSKLPELARGLGKGLREFRKATEDFKSTIEDEVNRPDPRAQQRRDNELPAQLVPPPGTLPQSAPPPSAIAPPLGTPQTESASDPVAGPVPDDIAAPNPADAEPKKA